MFIVMTLTTKRATTGAGIFRSRTTLSWMVFFDHESILFIKKFLLGFNLLSEGFRGRTPLKKIITLEEIKTIKS